MGKRLLFAILVIPFSLLCAVILVASVFYWIATGKNLLSVIDKLKDKMNGLL